MEPREFPSPPEPGAPAAEYTPPLPEFTPVGVTVPAEDKPKRRRFRFLLYIAAAALLVWIVFGGGAVTPSAGDTADVPPAAVTPVPEEAEPEPTPAATPEPTAAPTPTPEPTPVPEPRCEIVLIGFSATFGGRVYFYDQEPVTKATARLVEPILDVTIWESEIPLEDVAAGEYTLPEIELHPVYFEHMDEYDALGTYPQDADIYVTITYDAGEGEQTLEFTQRSKQEQGWSVRYWPESDIATQYSYPGCFGFITYEGFDLNTIVIDDADAVEDGVISVKLTLPDGRVIEPDDAAIDVRESQVSLEDGSTTSMYTVWVIMPLPDGLPEGSGTAHAEITQYLRGYDRIWTTERDVDF